MHDRLEAFQVLRRDFLTFIDVVANFPPDRDKEKMRVMQVVPIAGNLELSGNHTREHHPGLNASFSVVRRNDSDREQ